MTLFNLDAEFTAFLTAKKKIKRNKLAFGREWYESIRLG
jgi:hypothetical protein